MMGKKYLYLIIVRNSEYINYIEQLLPFLLTKLILIETITLIEKLVKITYQVDCLNIIKNYAIVRASDGITLQYLKTVNHL